MNDTSLATLPETSSNERIAAAIAHGGTCVAWFFAPLVVYLIERDRSSFVARHALSALLWSLAGTVVSALTCGVAIPVFLVVHVVAAVRVLQGRTFEYPFVSDLASRLASR